MYVPIDLASAVGAPLSAAGLDDGGARLWGSRVERPLHELEQLQADLAAAACEHLLDEPSRGSRAKPRRQPNHGSVAYQAYLKGRYFWNKWTPESLRTAIGYYRQAIDHDPAYALAWAGLADSYAVLANIKAVPPQEGYPQARAAAERALELAPDLAPAHASPGFVRRFYDWDWAGSERAFPTALARGPTPGKLLTASQAPGLRVHKSGLPFDDASGDRLRAWLGVDRATFYDTSRICIAPMGFCFPGYDASGSDIPPRRECAPSS